MAQQEILQRRIFEISEHEYVIEGINYWLNNDPEKSEQFFKLNSDRTTVLAGYAFVQCMVCSPNFTNCFDCNIYLLRKSGVIASLAYAMNC